MKPGISVAIQVPSGTGPGCSPNYTTPPGEPCVPGGGDLACEDLAPWGISEAYVVGQDEYGFDRDGDGTGCETSLPRQATPLGDLWADIAPIALPAMILVVALVAAGGSRYLHRLYQEADTEAERRAFRASVVLLVVTCVPVAIIGSLALALVGLD